MRFNEFIAEIVDKFKNSFTFCAAVSLGRHAKSGSAFPQELLDLWESPSDVKFALVIKNHDLAWLGPINDALVVSLSSFARLHSLGPNFLVVLNEELAKKYKLAE